MTVIKFHQNMMNFGGRAFSSMLFTLYTYMFQLSFRHFYATDAARSCIEIARTALSSVAFIVLVGQISISSNTSLAYAQLN